MLSSMFAGLSTALATPFFPNGDINWEALRTLVEMQIEAGVNSLVPCGTTGESPTLTPDEQIEVIKFVVEVVGRRVPVLAGTGSNCTAEAIYLTNRAKKVGANGALVVLPYYNKPPEAGQIDYFQKIAEVGLPIIAYDIPGRTGIQMSAKTILKLAAEGTIVGLKWASGDFNQLMDVIQGRPDGFTILSGDDNLTLPLMALGGDGVISVVSNLIPKIMKEFIDEAQLHESANTQEYHYNLLDLMRAMFITTNPIPIKTALSIIDPLTFGEEPGFRSPMVPMEKNEVEKLAAIISVYRERGILPKEQ